MIKRKFLILGCVDLGIIGVSYAAALLLACLSDGAVLDASRLWLPVLVLLGSYVLCFGLFGINSAIWRYADEIEYIKILLASLAVGGACALSMIAFAVIEAAIYFQIGRAHV